ncbi:MAG: HAMP domain-containing protein, partial [Solirubrobacterales bacterium]
MFGALTVKNRIYGGFSILILFLAIVAGMAVVSLKGVGGDVRHFGSSAEDTVSVLKIDRAVADMRRAVLAFVDKGDPKIAEGIRATIASLRKDLAESARTNPEPENKAVLEEMRRILDEYATSFDRAVTLRQDRDKIITALTPVGNEAVQHLSELMANAAAEKDWETGTYAGQGLQELLIIRLNAVRILSIFDPKAIDAANQKLTSLMALLTKLASEEKDQRHRKLMVAAADLLPVYQKGFAELTSTQAELDQIMTNALPPLGLKFAEKAATVRDSELAGMDSTERKLDDDIAHTTLLTQGLSALAILLGIAFAVLIARSIVNPVNAMTGAMGELAGGRLDVQVPALERHDEIGQMAKAVQVFKQNAIDKK